MLTAELEAEQASISGQLPRSPELRLRDRRTAEFHHPTIDPGLPAKRSDLPRQGPIRAHSCPSSPLSTKCHATLRPLPRNFSYPPSVLSPYRPMCSPASAPPPYSGSTPISWTSRPTSRTACPPSPPWGCCRGR